MTVNTTIDGKFHILQIQGEVDASNALALDNEIESVLSEGAKNILVDCSEMTYIASAGLGVFMSKIQDFKKNEIYFSLCSLSTNVKNAFDILGLHEFIKITESLNSAKESINDEANDC